MNPDKPVLDACCGSRMFWFDKQDARAVFADTRTESHVLCDGRVLNIAPDVQMDFRKMPFDDASFKLIVFDPPHLISLGANSWMAKKYGILNRTWQDDIKQGFDECMRCLDEYGTLIFKWNETQIKTSEVVRVIGEKPLFGHTSGRAAKTIWMTFLKTPELIAP